MSMLVRFKNFVDELESREYYRYLAIGMVIFFLVIGFMVYFHNRKLGSLQKEFQRVNRQRQQARELLEKHAVVKQQRLQVSEILAQDKTFKIKEYFSQIVAELNLQNNISKEAEISEPQDLDNGYSEIKLDASFTKLDMKDLATLLYKIETNRRIYTKELVVVKALESPTIDVTLVIATLQPRTEI